MRCDFRRRNVPILCCWKGKDCGGDGDKSGLFFLSINEIVEMVAPASWKIFFAHLSSKVDCIIPQRGICTGCKGHKGGRQVLKQRIIELTLLT